MAVNRWVYALLKNPDRKYVLKQLMIEKPPVTLVVSWLQANKPLMDRPVWEILANIEECPTELAYQFIAFNVKPNKKRIKWPKRKAK